MTWGQRCGPAPLQRAPIRHPQARRPHGSLRKTCRLLFLLVAATWFVSPCLIGAERPPVSLLFLMDSSGSMKKNDPSNIRIVAAQSLVSLLSDRDQVTVYEFDSTARSSSGGVAPVWTAAGKRGAIFEALATLGNSGEFTDFRAALVDVLRAFPEVPSNHPRIVLLLTDGIMEPNPRDSAYAPHHIRYPIDLLRARDKRKLSEDYRRLLTPVARRILTDEVYPAYRAAGVQVFAVGLGSQADTDFLQWAADETADGSAQVHVFHAQTATDLVPTFLQLLQYWTDRSVLHVVEGEASTARQELYLDKYALDPRLVTFIDGDARMRTNGPSGRLESAEPGTRPGLQLFRLTDPTPGSWSLSFENGAGRFHSVAVGDNGLALEVTGLKKQYRFGEEISLRARITTKAGLERPKRGEMEVSANLTPAPGSRGQDVRTTLTETGEEFVLRQASPTAGRYRLRLSARSRPGLQHLILPRNGLLYQIEVLPSFYVTPARLSFGVTPAGSTVRRAVTIHSGLTERVSPVIRGRLLSASNSAFAQSRRDELPTVHESHLAVEPGSVMECAVELNVPDDAAWGDYEGQIRFESAGKMLYEIPFSAHVPSLWEKLRWWMVVVGLLLLLLFGYLVGIWSLLPIPRGVLVPVGDCPGPLRQPRKLSNIRRGLFTSWFHYKRNRIRFSDMPLTGIPAGCDAELTFYRWGAAFIRNTSRQGSGCELQVEEPDRPSLGRGIGRSLRLKNGAVLQMGECKYRYERGR